MMSPPMSLAQCTLGQFQCVNDEAGTLADSTFTANCNNRDFGMSRWQLSIKCYTNLLRRGRPFLDLAAATIADSRGSFRGNSGQARASVERPAFDPKRTLADLFNHLIGER